MRSKYVLFPLWIGLLAWPLAGGARAAELCLTLIIGSVTAWGISRLADSAPFQKKMTVLLSLFGRAEKSLIQLSGGKTFFLAGGIILICLPVFLNNYYLDILNLAALYALLAVGLNITVGYAGLLDLGYAAFFGVGAYTYAILSTRFGISFWWGLPLGALISAFFGLLLGIITLRLRGDYLAIVTLGFVQILYLSLNNWDAVTQGPNGIMQIGRPEIAAFVIKQPIHFYYLIFSVLLIITVLIDRLLHSQIGRAWIAIREDALAAEVMGINTTQMKTLAFVLGAGIGGLGGVLFAARYTFISPESFTFLESVRILSMVVLGGMGSLPGVILGAVLLTILPELLRELANYRMLIFGAAMVLMMLFRPQGLWGTKHDT